MANYMDSKYYEFSYNLIISGKIKTPEGQAEDLKNYEAELNWPDNGGDWLASHFNSTAEYLAETDLDCFTDEDFEKYVAQARKEIEITRKANGGRYENFASMYEGWLREAINERWIAVTGKILEA